jgi:uncharacterized membrane protein YebE (DUF533 family)
MPKPRVIKSLAKVIIAAAWADGDISHEELNSLKDLLFLMPEMTAKDWAELDIYIEEPVGEEERARLIEELRANLMRPSDRKLALQALETVIEADGMVNEGERQVLQEIKDELTHAGVGLFTQFGAWCDPLSNAARRRSQRYPTGKRTWWILCAIRSITASTG